MAIFASLPQCAQQRMHKHWLGAANHVQKSICPRRHLRCHPEGHNLLRPWKHSTAEASFAINTQRSRLQRGLVPRFYCIGSLLSPENAAPQNWVPVFDQILLMTSIVFAYMAGVAPQDKAFPYAQQSLGDKHSSVSDSSIPGRFTEKQTGNDVDCWSEVKGKLVDAMDAFDHDATLHIDAVDLDKRSANRPLSLLSITGGPRLRLLCITLQWLHKEVETIPQIHEDIDRDAWLVISYRLIQGSVQPVLVEWLAGELTLVNKEEDKELMGKIYGRLSGDDSLIEKSIGLEKMNLHADLLFFLRFGSFSVQTYYNNNMLREFANDILEDLVISLADGVSNIYMELISVDSDISSEINNMGLSLCSLSTRGLQKLRNEVALNGWLLQNFQSVVSMYEDRFVLCILKRKSLQESHSDMTKNVSWWKKLLFRKSAASNQPLKYVLLTQSDIFVKRTKELRVLKGWKYYYSLFLEFSDIMMPLVRVIFVKIRDAVSFLFVSLIGRSLGLIYTGIRQSLSWR